MKEVLQLLPALWAVFLGGCATQQLSLEKPGKNLAQRLSVEESEIQFLGHGNFVARFEDLDRRVVAKKGIIALTESHLRLETRHFSHLFSKDSTAIPFREMEGVSRIESQVHIKYGGREILLEFNPGSFRNDPAKASATVFQMLVSHGIPVYEVAELKKFPPSFRRPRRSEDYYPDDRPRDDSHDGFYSGRIY